MITAAQMRAARALLGIDQQTLAELADVSLPTIQRMEASHGNVRGVVGTLMKVVEAFERAGIELIGDKAPSQGTGRGVRFRVAASADKATGPPTAASGRRRPRPKA
ncbi:MAG: helix-turn-helix domain-containing protein [Alphaproteobacteria bacterium]|nr:helix-turn-helix domain-containing protein [Alphaproteobacteria bacterium]